MVMLKLGSKGFLSLCEQFHLLTMCLMFTLFDNLVMVVCRSVFVLSTSLLLPEVVTSVMTGTDLALSG